jgi:hypothetical protein
MHTFTRCRFRIRDTTIHGSKAAVSPCSVDCVGAGCSGRLCCPLCSRRPMPTPPYGSTLSPSSSRYGTCTYRYMHIRTYGQIQAQNCAFCARLAYFGHRGIVSKHKYGFMTPGCPLKGPSCLCLAGVGGVVAGRVCHYGPGGPQGCVQPTTTEPAGQHHDP